MKQTLCVALTLVCSSVLATSTSQAAQQPEFMTGLRYFESAQDPQPRLQRSVAHQPRSKSPAWDGFLAAEGGTWYSTWDEHTQVPLRIYGSGIAAPGSVADAAHAERHARTVLTRHLALLAPGATIRDFDLVVNDLTNDMRTVVFQQHYNGMPVLDGRVSFIFKHDRLIVIGSEAVPTTEGLAPFVTSSRVAVSDAMAQTKALDWMRADYGQDAQVKSVEGPVIVPIISDDKQVRIRAAGTVMVTVVTRSKPGIWQVYVDMKDGSPVARRQMLRFGTGEIRYNTPVRWPGSTRMDYPAIYANTTVDGAAQTSDIDGMVSWVGTNAAALGVQVSGPYIELINMSGGAYTATGSLPDGGFLTFNAANAEYDDAQLTSFVHTQIAQREARILNPGLAWLDRPIQVTVNIPSDLLGMLFCNAYSDGDTINFFEAFSLPPFIDCGNTGRLPDVVYHEFGHSLHFQSLTSGSFDVALSEGLSDYYASTITNDPQMGRGFFNNNDPLRDIDPVDGEATWPDDIDMDPHITGLIIAGAMWDLRTELVNSMGPVAGRAYADRLFYAALQQATDIPATYAHVLAADDDDGNIANGTPNSCLINQTFGNHGLSNPLAGGSLLTQPIQVDGLTVSFETIPTAGVCPPPEVSGATLSWQLRDDPTTSGDVPMVNTDGTFSAEIPAQADDTVVQYMIQMQLDNGETADFPRNPADPMYELYIGPVEEIYCTDFETDPFAEGWTSGSPNDWGTPTGGAGDPTQAYSGNNVLGNVIDGAYSPDSSVTLRSPTIDISGYANARLQYRRWLGVEDGMFDQATISANGTALWTNQNSGNMTGGLNHVDGEWRFHDVDLSQFVGSGSVQLEFSITSDPGLELGGWTMDDLCIVAATYCGDGRVNGNETCDDGAANNDSAADACRTTCVAASCGDNVVDTGEECDDGVGNSDSSANACRTSCLAATCGDSVIDSGEQCDDGNLTAGDGCNANCLMEATADSGGCCRSNGPSPGDGLLCLMVLGLAVFMRRRKRASLATSASI